MHPDVAALPDDHFDAVTLWNVVDFFSQPVEQLRQIHRVLAPRGLVFVRTPNAAYQMAAWRLRRVLVWPPPVARLLTEAYFFHPMVWAPRTLRQLLLCAGLTDITLWNSDASFIAASSLPQSGWLHGGRQAEHAVRLVARSAVRPLRGRLLVGSSISALARKPA